MITPQIEALGECALLIRFGATIDAQVNARVHAAAAALQAATLPGVFDIAPAYASVGLHYDPRAWADPNAASAFGHIAARVAQLLRHLDFSNNVASSTTVEIPVCYGGDCGPDLPEVSARAGFDPAQVIARHVAVEYRVAMLGFAPGFPYLLGLDAALHTPRRSSPRTRVPAGSVAIGGAQTGIYPRDLPGGWHIIGRTPLTLFDVSRDPPALLAPGQCVRFRAVDAAEFAQIAPGPQR